MRRIAWLLSLVALSLLVVGALAFAQWSASSTAGQAASDPPRTEMGAMRGGGGMGGGMRGGPGMMGGPGAHQACAMGLTLSRSQLVVAREDMYQVYAGQIVKLDRKLNVVKAVDLPGLLPAAGAPAEPHAFAAAFFPSLVVDNLDVYVGAGGTVYKFDRNLNLVSQRQLPMPTDGRLAAMCPMAMMGGGMGGMAGGGGMMGGGRMMGRGGMPGAPGAAPRPTRWTANLTGEPLRLNIKGTGKAELRLAENGDEISYRLTLTDLRDPNEAHLHWVAPGSSLAQAPVVAPLYSGPTRKGTFRGTLAEGTITAASLIGPMKGRTVNDLVEALNAGQIVVMVHTAQYPKGAIAGVAVPAG